MASFDVNTDFVTIDFNLDANDMADTAIETLRTSWPDWEPSDGDLDVVLIETIAPMAAEAGYIASQMPVEALRTLGIDLFGVSYLAGSPATTTVTLTFIDTVGYTVAGGSQVEIDGVAFQLVADAVRSPGSTTLAGVPVQSVDSTAAANNLTGASVAPISMPPYVTLIAVTGGATTGGVDPETDDAYVARLSRDLQLRAKTLVSVRDFEVEALNFAGIGRAHAVGDTARNVTVYVTDTLGNAVSGTIKTNLAADYAQYAQVNTVYTISDPSYETVTVTWVVTAEPNVDPTALAASINLTLATALSPATWGLPSGQPPTSLWISDNVIRIYKLVSLIGNVPGVKYVESVALAGDNIGTRSVPTLSAGLSTGGAITSLPVNSTKDSIGNGTILTLTDPTGLHTQNWTVAAELNAGGTAITVASQTPNFAYPAGSTLTGGGVRTNIAATSWGAQPLTNKIPSGSVITVHDPTNTHTQAFTTTADANVGATVIAVASQTPNYAYPTGSYYSGPVSGDLTMPGVVPLPKSGTHAGTVHTSV